MDNITVKEFKMWLQGVEEMQDEDWSPTYTQWVKIREKIDILSEDVVSHAPVAPVSVNQAPPKPVIRADGTVVATGPVVAAAPSIMASTPTVARPRDAGDFVPPPPPNNPLFGNAGTVKTPNIEGTYESGFV